MHDHSAHCYAWAVYQIGRARSIAKHGAKARTYGVLCGYFVPWED